MSKGNRYNKPTQPFEARIFWDHTERELANGKKKRLTKKDKALNARYAKLRNQGKLK